jgi:hypothetical protein
MSSAAYKANYSLIDWSGARRQQRRAKIAPKRSGLACPMLIRSFAEPVQSMADGKFYDTPRDLEKTYRADGNPRGEEFIPLGNETLKTTEYVPDASERRNDMREALHDVVSGNLPPEIAAIE